MKRFLCISLIFFSFQLIKTAHLNNNYLDFNKINRIEIGNLKKEYFEFPCQFFEISLVDFREFTCREVYQLKIYYKNIINKDIMIETTGIIANQIYKLKRKDCYVYLKFELYRNWQDCEINENVLVRIEKPELDKRYIFYKE